MAERATQQRRLCSIIKHATAAAYGALAGSTITSDAGAKQESQACYLPRREYRLAQIFVLQAAEDLRWMTRCFGWGDQKILVRCFWRAGRGWGGPNVSVRCTDGCKENYNIYPRDKKTSPRASAHARMPPAPLRRNDSTPAAGSTDQTLHACVGGRSAVWC